MSHAPERKEKDCLNCGTIVHGHFCHVCGQANIVPKESFWSLVTHFFYDITHFDSKFFHTLKYLLFRPGFLSTEYLKGRRASYLNPIKMYVFTSAFFFIVFFSLFSAEMFNIGSKNEDRLDQVVNNFSEEAFKNAKTKEDSLNIEKALSLISPDTEKVIDTVDDDRPKASVTLGDRATKYKTVGAYDSAQKLLPRSERDNWFISLLNKKGISLRQKYGNDNKKLWKDLMDKFIHSFPYLLFVSLPLYALWLKLLYIRRKQFYFADHGIFLVHLYIFTFLLLLVFFGFDKLESVTGLGVWSFFKVIIGAYGIYYAFRAMKNFYGQRGGKTFLKFTLFNFVCLISLVLLFAVFLIFSIFRI